MRGGVGNGGVALLMVAAGIGIPAMAAMSGTLGTHLTSPAAATTALIGVAFTAALVLTLSTDRTAFSGLATAPLHLLTGGLCVAFYALSITYAGPRMGIANAIFCVLFGQMIGAALIDHFGLLGAPRTNLGLRRSIGILIMMAGLFLAQSRTLKFAAPT